MNLKQTNTSSDIATDDIDIGKLLGVLLDARWFIVIVTMISVFLGVAYSLSLTPIYRADTLIQVEKKTSGMSALVGDMGSMFADDSSAITEIEIIKSRMILGETVDSLNLITQVNPVYLPFIGQGIARITGEQHSAQVERFEIPAAEPQVGSFDLVVTNAAAGEYQLLGVDERLILTGTVGQLSQGKGYKLFVSLLKAKDNDVFKLSRNTRLQQIQRLQNNLTITERGKQSGILSLSITGAHPKEIENILNDIAQNYFLQNVERKSTEVEKSLDFLNRNLPSIKDQLTESENLLNQYLQKNESIDLGFEAQATLTAMIELEAKLQELSIKENELSQRFTRDHPSYQSLLDNRSALQKEKERLDGLVQKLPESQRAVLRLQRDVEVNQQIYIQLLNKVQELRIVKAGTVGSVRILDGAQTFPHPIKPKKSLIVAIATLLGGMLAVGLVLLKSMLHHGVQSPDQVESLGLPVYASIPRSDMQEKLNAKVRPSSKRKRSKNKRKMALSGSSGTLGKSSVNITELLLAEANPADLSIEALRGLRTSLHFAMMEAKNRIVMISGPSPDIGKSFVSANFAAVTAKTGQKVLLIDADMRKGYLQSHFGLAAENGLSDIITGSLSAESAIKTSGVDNLDLVTRGAIPPNPSELLMHPRFTEFMDWASAHYDLVIIDTPPILAVTDAGIVGALAGTSLMVGRFDQNTLKEIEVSYNRFDQVGVEIKGFILNAVEKKASSYYGGYGYYNYSYKSDT